MRGGQVFGLCTRKFSGMRSVPVGKPSISPNLVEAEMFHYRHRSEIDAGLRLDGSQFAKEVQKIWASS